MPEYVVAARRRRAEHRCKKPINGSRVHLFGVAYKRDVNDMRESPALDVIELLIRRGATVTYTDPWVPTRPRAGTTTRVDGLRRGARRRVRLRGDHHRPCRVRLRALAKLPLVVDTRNALKGYSGSNIVRL